MPYVEANLPHFLKTGTPKRFTTQTTRVILLGYLNLPYTVVLLGKYKRYFVRKYNGVINKRLINGNKMNGSNLFEVTSNFSWRQYCPLSL